ncbi:MAG: hypothetical protein WCL07_04695 [bacterium]
MKRNGYRPSYKNRWLLRIGEVLTLQQWALYEYLLDCMDWDPRHDNFGLFEFFPDEMVGVFHKSPESIGDWFKYLVEKRFVKLFDKKRKLYGMKNPERYIFGKASQYELSERNITVEKLLENICFSENEMEITKVIQENIPKISMPLIWSDTPKALSSFKDDLSIENRQAGRDLDGYREIYKNEGYSFLLPEDMMWIDQSQSFDKPIIRKKVETMTDREVDDIFLRGKYV